MFERGKIVLVPFPFTDLSAQKIRPALILSSPKKIGDHVIVAFITSKKIETESTYCINIKKDPLLLKQTGLKIASNIRIDKIATLDKRIVLGEIGTLPTSLWQEVRAGLKQVFGL